MGRPRQFDPETTLDLAVDAFWEHGFEGTGVQELCRCLKLNPGSLYGAYGDKRALYIAAFDRYVAKISRDAIDRIAREPSGIAGIRAYFAHLVAAIVDGKRRWGCLVTNSVIELAAREPEIAAKVELHFARLETAFAGALARSRAAGELAPRIGPDTAPYLVCIVQGLNVLARTKPTRARLEAIVGTALDALS
jgi:TetR/AcrR family transcriptional repressor of nem operon